MGYIKSASGAAKNVWRAASGPWAAVWPCLVYRVTKNVFNVLSLNPKKKPS